MSRKKEKKQKEMSHELRRAALLVSMYDEQMTSAERKQLAQKLVERVEVTGATVETIVHNVMSPHPLDDARSKLTSEQKQAGEQIIQAFQIITSGAGPKMMNYSGMRYGAAGSFENESEFIIRLQRDYSLWSEKCLAQQIKKQIVLAFLIDGISAKRLDRVGGVRNGSSMQMIRQALDIFAEIRGFKEMSRAISKYRFIGELRAV